MELYNAKGADSGAGADEVDINKQERSLPKAAGKPSWVSSFTRTLIPARGEMGQKEKVTYTSFPLREVEGNLNHNFPLLTAKKKLYSDKRISMKEWQTSTVKSAFYYKICSDI